MYLSTFATISKYKPNNTPNQKNKNQKPKLKPKSTQTKNVNNKK